MKKGFIEVHKIITWILLIAFLIVILLFLTGKFGDITKIFLGLFK